MASLSGNFGQIPDGLTKGTALDIGKADDLPESEKDRLRDLSGVVVYGVPIGDEGLIKHHLNYTVDNVASIAFSTSLISGSKIAPLFLRKSRLLNWMTLFSVSRKGHVL